MSYRISGHETFPFRYTWLPKAVRNLGDNPQLFADEDEAMVVLGVGKNMVRSIRFWSQAAGVSKAIGKTGTHQLTDIGISLLGDRGLDPFLEDVRTLWLLHWHLSTDSFEPLLAWDYLLNHWHEPELTFTQAFRILQKEIARYDGSVSAATLEQHLTMFFHTYVPTRGRKGAVQEDNLDCPLVELELLRKVGDRELDRNSGRREAIYTFRREEKPEITPELFLYCLNDYWLKFHRAELTLSLRDIAHGHGSPGQIFKLPEDDLRGRLEALRHQTSGRFVYDESSSLQSVRRSVEVSEEQLLNGVYSMEVESGR